MRRIQSRGVSPAISIILLTGVTVALFSLATITSFDILDSIVDERSDATVSLSYESNSGTGTPIGVLSATFADNQNSDTVIVQTPSGNQTELTSVGSTERIDIFEEGAAFVRADDTIISRIIIRDT